MKRLMMIAAVAIGMAGPAFAADPLEGIWQTRPDDNGNFGHVQVAACGDRLCGVLIKSFDSSGAPRQSENIGKQIIWDMVARGGGAYAKGKIWSPDRDKTYNSRMQMTGDSVAVSGCVLGICRDGGTWTRVQ